MVPRPDDLKIEIPPREDPFAIDARPIGSLLQFAPQATYGHRVKVVGTVIYFEPGRGNVSAGWRSRRGSANQATRPVCNSAITSKSLGYVSQGDYTPVLQDARLPEDLAAASRRRPRT